MNFRPELAQAVMDGRKTVTRRPLSDKPRSPWHVDAQWPSGKVFAVCPGRSKSNIGHARVITARKVQLGRLTLDDARSEGFGTIGEFEKTWRSLHAGEYDERAVVWRVEFEVVDIGTCKACGHPGDDCICWYIAEQREHAVERPF